MKKVALMLAIGVSIFLFAACAKFSRPAFFGPVLEVSARQQTVNLVSARSAEINSFRALLRAKLKFGTRRSSVRYVFLTEPPQRLRLEALAPNAMYAMAVLIANGDSMLLLDPAPKRAYAGTSDVAQIKRSINIPLSVEWLSSLVTGRLPSSYVAMLQSEKMEFRRSADTGAIMLREGEFERYFEFDPVTGLLQRAQIRDPFSSKLQIELKFTQYFASEDIFIPAHIDIALPQDDANLALNLTNPKLNRAIAPDMFGLEIPAGYQSERF